MMRSFRSSAWLTFSAVRSDEAKESLCNADGFLQLVQQITPDGCETAISDELARLLLCFYAVAFQNILLNYNRRDVVCARMQCERAGALAEHKDGSLNVPDVIEEYSAYPEDLQELVRRHISYPEFVRLFLEEPWYESQEAAGAILQIADDL